jgi:hypothetical protein
MCGIFTKVAIAGAITGIVVSCLGLAGVCSIKAVCITGLVTQPFNIPVFITSIVGLTGNATMGVVSGVNLGFSILSLMILSAKKFCCDPIFSAGEDCAKQFYSKFLGS